MQTPSLALAILAVVSASAFAAPITYTSSYTASAMPSTSGGTIENPSWHLIANGGSSGVANGLLSADTMPNGSAQQYWIIGTSGSTTYGTANAWDIDGSTGATIDLALKINSATPAPGTSPQVLGGFSIVVGDGSNWAGIFFDTTKISFWGQSIQFSAPRDNTVLQTYRIVIQDGLFSLYEAGSDSAIFELEDMNTGGNPTLYFGDGSSGASGAFDLAFLGWSNQVAEYSAPPEFIPVPEPSSLLLLGCTVAGGLAFYRRKR